MNTVDWTDAEREVVRRLMPGLGDLHVYSCRCHGDDDPAATHHSLGVRDGAWYAPECVDRAHAAHRARDAAIDAVLAALAPFVAAREAQAAARERDRLVAAWNAAEETRALALREALAPSEDAGHAFERGESS